jgi:hypothetical protein
MIDSAIHAELTERIAERIAEDRRLLDELRREVARLKDQVHKIQPRTVTSIAFAGTDGATNQLRFEPFLVQLIRVVDSSNNSYAINVITPESDVKALSDRLLSDAKSELGEMMRFFGVGSVGADRKLSHF